jgi:hypothetical protein
MRASGWLFDTAGSSDSGSPPDTYRRIFPDGGVVVPKYRDDALVMQPVIDQTSSAITAIESERRIT